MATIYDIARASGVSATTVSHVLNRTRYVSPEITARVLAAVQELGYSPMRCRGGNEETTKAKRGCMGFIIDRQLLTVCGCRAYARMADKYEWITISVDGSLTEKQLLRYIKQYRLNRVLIHQSVEYRCGDQPIGTVEPGSVLLLNQSTPAARIDHRHLTLDYEGAVRVALEHLIRCGHTSITVVGGNLNRCCQEHILRALETCGKRHAVRLNRDNILWLNGENDAAIKERGSLGSAVISIGVPGIMAITKYCFNSGCNAPQDFSWVAVDDDDFMQGYNPGVTYVRLNPELFRSMVEASSENDKRIISSPEMVIRHSTRVYPRDNQGQPVGGEKGVSLTITEKMLMKKRTGKIGVSFAQIDTLYSQMLLQGIKETAANLNLELLPVQDARMNGELEKNQLVWLLQNGADAVISISNDHSNMVETFLRLRRGSDVPLILGSHLPPNLASSAYQCCITTNDEEKGRQAAQFMADQMLPHKMQQLIIMADKSTAAGAQQCVRAMMTTLYGDYPQIHVLEQMDINGQYSRDDFESLYRSYPKMQGLFIQNAEVAARVSSWLQNMGRSDVVIATGQINSTIAHRMLQATNERIGLVSSQPIKMGHLMVYSAVCHLLGKPTPKYVSVDPVTLTKRNVEELWPLLTQSRLI